MPRKSTNTRDSEVKKKPTAEELNRDNLGRFKPGNTEGKRFSAGIPSPEDSPHLVRTCKFKPEYTQMLIDYYNEPLYDEYRDSFGKLYRMSRPLPSKIGFARRIGVWFDTVENWAKMTNPDGTPLFPDFKAAWELVEKLSKQNIIDASNDGVHNANFGKFLLSAVHGMREKAPEDNSVTVFIKTEDPEFDEDSQ